MFKCVFCRYFDFQENKTKYDNHTIDIWHSNVGTGRVINWFTVSMEEIGNYM